MPFCCTSLTWNIGWIMAWSSARIRCGPFGPTNFQPSSAVIIRSTLSPSPFCTARTIICAATKPSGVKMSGTWLRRFIFLTSQSLTLFFGAV